MTSDSKRIKTAYIPCVVSHSRSVQTQKNVPYTSVYLILGPYLDEDALP